jgi:hypothetical protein
VGLGYREFGHCDNEFLRYRFWGLSVHNLSQVGFEGASAPVESVRLQTNQALSWLLRVSRFYAGRSFESNAQNLMATQTLVGHNQFRATQPDDTRSYEFSLILPESRVVFDANSCHTAGRQTLGRIHDARFLVVTNNLLDAALPDVGTPMLIDATRTSSLIVTSNLATTGSPIQLVGVAGTVLRKDNNLPPIP